MNRNSQEIIATQEFEDFKKTVNNDQTVIHFCQVHGTSKVSVILDGLFEADQLQVIVNEAKARASQLRLAEARNNIKEVK